MNTCTSRQEDRTVPTERTLLLVTDLSIGSEECIQAAALLSDTHCTKVELIYVVDLEQASSRPDAQMGIQYRLDTMLQSLKRFQNRVRAVLLFGSPETAIVQRANDIQANLIALTSNPASSKQAQQGLVRRLTRRVSCPVVVLPNAVS